MKNAAFVIRISDPRQETSPENQRSQLESYIELFNARARAGEDPNNQLQLFREYELIGVSGKDSFDSREFDELRADISRGKIDMVMATGLDRFGRNVARFLEFFEFLQQNQVGLVVTQYQIDTTGPIGVLVITILMALAEMQRQQYSAKQIGTQHERFLKGRKTGGTVPLGFDSHPTETGLYVINEAEAAIVRLAFSSYLELRNLTAVALKLNDRGFRTKRWTTTDGSVRGGQRFDCGSVRYILMNWIYIGVLEEHKKNRNKPDSDVPEKLRYRKYTPNDPDEWPKIIDDETFRKVQALLGEHATSNKAGTRRTHPYPLSGLVYCGICGAKMKADKGKNRHYYTCDNASCEGRDIIPKTFSRIKRNAIDARVLESAVSRLIRDAVLADSSAVKLMTEQANRQLHAELPALANEIHSLERRRKGLCGKRDGILATIGDNGDKKLTPEMSDHLTDDLRSVISDIQQIDSQIASRRSELQRGEQQELPEAAIRRALEVFQISLEGVPEQQHKALLEGLFTRIELGVKELAVHFRLNTIHYLARKGPNPHEFDWTKDWYARQESNPQPSGP